MFRTASWWLVWQDAELRTRAAMVMGWLQALAVRKVANDARPKDFECLNLSGCNRPNSSSCKQPFCRCQMQWLGAEVNPSESLKYSKELLTCQTHQWMLEDVGRCWKILEDVGRCWMSCPRPLRPKLKGASNLARLQGSCSLKWPSWPSWPSCIERWHVKLSNPERPPNIPIHAEPQPIYCTIGVYIYIYTIICIKYMILYYNILYI